MTSVRFPSILCAAVLAFPAVLPAQERDCSRYALSDLIPGMGPKTARRILMDNGFEIDSDSREALEGSTEVYRHSATLLHVRYDRHVSRKDAAVLMLRTEVPVSRVDVGNRLASLLERFGEPLMGRPNIEEGLVAGPVVWVDEACNIEVTAFRTLPAWWEQRQASICVEIRRLQNHLPVPLDTR